MCYYEYNSRLLLAVILLYLTLASQCSPCLYVGKTESESRRGFSVLKRCRSDVASRVISLAVDNCIAKQQQLQPPVRITLQQQQVWFPCTRPFFLHFRYFLFWPCIYGRWNWLTVTQFLSAQDIFVYFVTSNRVVCLCFQNKMEDMSEQCAYWDYSIQPKYDLSLCLVLSVIV